jgi:hypothetical protein
MINEQIVFQWYEVKFEVYAKSSVRIGIVKWDPLIEFTAGGINEARTGSVVN